MGCLMAYDSAALWYATLEKPFFAPPAWVFGPVWSVLYVLITISFGYVFLQTISGRWPWRIALPFGINLAANLLFSPLQFGVQNTVLAAIDIVVVFATIPWMMRVVWKRKPVIAYLQIPYLLWVSFAMVLQLSITWLNW